MLVLYLRRTYATSNRTADLESGAQYRCSGREASSVYDKRMDQKTLIAMTSVCLGTKRRYQFAALVLAVKRASDLYPFPS